MEKIIGIDLGTTNSCVAVMEDGKPKIIANLDGGRTTPSVVFLTETGERIVGERARRQAAEHPDDTISSIKRYMGSNYRASLGNKAYKPQEISAMILRRLKEDAEAYLGCEVKEAVITVPAYYNDAQRQATKKAGVLAGFTVRRIINEPTSAALAYGLDQEKEQKVMVYDLGGGTFDVSVIRIGGGVVEVLATSGDNHLGGDDYDARLALHLLKMSGEDTAVSLPEDPVLRQKLTEEAERLKKELSFEKKVEVNRNISGRNGKMLSLSGTITREEFDALTFDLVERTTIPVKNALKDAGLAAEDLDKVLLVGGSTRIPAVQKKVKELTGLVPEDDVNPDECVAMGAAIQGGKLAGEEGLSDLLLLDVTPLSLSIETLGGRANHLIEKNSPIPVRCSKIFTTSINYQKAVEIRVYQGERPMVEDNRRIGDFKLKGIRRAKRGVPEIEVTFDIDVNGILNVSAKDLATGKEQSVVITESAELSADEIQDVLEEAKHYEKADMERKRNVEFCNAAEDLFYFVDYARKRKPGRSLSLSQRWKIYKDLRKLKKAVERTEVDNATNEQALAVLKAMETLKESAADLLSYEGKK